MVHAERLGGSAAARAAPCVQVLDGGAHFVRLCIGQLLGIRGVVRLSGGSPATEAQLAGRLTP